MPCSSADRHNRGNFNAGRAYSRPKISDILDIIPNGNDISMRHMRHMKHMKGTPLHSIDANALKHLGAADAMWTGSMPEKAKETLEISDFQASISHVWGEAIPLKRRGWNSVSHVFLRISPGMPILLRSVQRLFPTSGRQTPSIILIVHSVS
jgi:hypothetical protein